MTIIGMNVEAQAGSWMTVAGNVLFLLGLLLEGIYWFRKKKEEENKEEENKKEKEDS